MTKQIIIFIAGILVLMNSAARNAYHFKSENEKRQTTVIQKQGTLNGIESSVTIIGSGSPQYNPQRSGPSALVQFNGVKFLVDMGNGTRAQLEKLGA